MKHCLCLSSLVVALAACGAAGSSAPAAATAPAGGKAAQLASLYAEYWEENRKLNPLQATQVGDPRYNDQLPNALAPDYRARLRAFRQRYLDRAKAIGGDGISGQDRLSYDIFVRDQASELEGFDYPAHLM